MKLEIVPYEKMALIKVGMKRHEVREVVKAEVDSYKKTKWDDNLNDSFKKGYYDN